MSVKTGAGEVGDDWVAATAAAVGADEGGDRAGFNRQGHLLQCMQAAEGTGQILGTQHGGAHGRRLKIPMMPCGRKVTMTISTAP